MKPQHWMVLGLTLLGVAAPAGAYRNCYQPGGSGPTGHWPDPNNIGHFGTEKWDFDWRINSEGLEVVNVRYSSNPALPKKMVLLRGSLPFLPVHYPGSHSYPDILTTWSLDASNPFCCLHVPTTVCSLPDRTIGCMPLSGTIDPATCPGGSLSCSGVCVGTQVDLIPPVEDGIGEVVSGATSADVVLSTTFRLGGYQFVQRWRFQDDGTILPSIRLGGIHDCLLHNHQIYWRFNFQLVADGDAKHEVVEQCDAGGCPDVGSSGWSSPLGCTCGNRPQPGTSWRIGDAMASDRRVVVESSATEGKAETFCEGTAANCPGGCLNSRDFCALSAAEPTETFAANACDDKLADGLLSAGCSALPGGSDIVFWYFGHVDKHDPATFLPMCDPEPGTVAFGPRIRLVGTW